MSRSRCEIPGKSHVGDILGAAKAWRNLCFIGGGSIMRIYKNHTAKICAAPNPTCRAGKKLWILQKTKIGLLVHRLACLPQ